MSVLTTAQINGFRPARQYSSDKVFTFPVTNDGSTTLAIGDAFTLVAGNGTKLLLTDSPTYPVVGVVVGLRNANGRQLTFNEPTLGNYLPADTSGFAEVLIDDDMTYNVYYSGTTSNATVGTNLRANDAGVTVLSGLSGMSVRALSGSDATTTPFKVIGLGDTVIAGGAGTGVTIEVGLNNTWRRAGTLGQ